MTEDLWESHIDSLARDLERLHFQAPVAHVYNPLTYARAPILQYHSLYANGAREILFLGMNPGPFGMVQTGIPFGEVGMVRDYLGIDAPIGVPAEAHPKRPVQGWACTRSEVSGRRLWGWVREHYPAPSDFFARHFVANYCPLAFLDAGGRNLTPDKLKPTEVEVLFARCDEALRELVEVLRIRRVIGVGQFARKRAEVALAGTGVRVDVILHPSPASPAANRGWDVAVDAALAEMGLDF